MWRRHEEGVGGRSQRGGGTVPAINYSLVSPYTAAQSVRGGGFCHLLQLGQALDTLTQIRYLPSYTICVFERILNTAGKGDFWRFGFVFWCGRR